MNFPVLIVACIMCLVVLAHVIGGTRETVSLRPEDGNAKQTDHWVQAMCAFQMLSVDLLVVAAALLALTCLDFGPAERPIILGFAGLFFLWGLAWIIQAYWLQRSPKSLLRLPHWLVWFLCSGLLIWGS